MSWFVLRYNTNSTFYKAPGSEKKKVKYVVLRKASQRLKEGSRLSRTSKHRLVN